MERVPRSGLYGKARQVFSYFADLQIPGHAAHAGYFIVLSLFPALVLAVGLLRFAGLEAQNLTSLLEELLPEVLMPYARRLIQNTYQKTTGAAISLSAMVALWSASRGVHGLLTGLRQVYRVKTQPSWLKRRLTSLFYTFLLLIVLLLTLVVQMFGNSLPNLLPIAQTPFYRFLADVLGLRFLLLPAVQTGLFAAIFSALPEKKCPLRCSLPGAMLACFGWLSFTKLYSVYVTYFTGYASIYGPVYAIALSMLWLYCCLSILFYGAALNVYLLENGEP